MRGFKAGHFSFNTGQGRCPVCAGKGVEVVEMHFLSDITIPCELCKGRRYNRETLAVTYKGKTIGDVLEMEVSQAAAFFTNHKRIHRILDVLVEVGLGYLKLGQAATTLSGGEAQRGEAGRRALPSRAGLHLLPARRAHHGPALR